MPIQDPSVCYKDMDPKLLLFKFCLALQYGLELCSAVLKNKEDTTNVEKDGVSSVHHCECVCA